MTKENLELRTCIIVCKKYLNIKKQVEDFSDNQDCFIDYSAMESRQRYLIANYTALFRVIERAGLNPEEIEEYAKKDLI